MTNRLKIIWVFIFMFLIFGSINEAIKYRADNQAKELNPCSLSCDSEN